MVHAALVMSLTFTSRTSTSPKSGVIFTTLCLVFLPKYYSVTNA